VKYLGAWSHLLSAFEITAGRTRRFDHPTCGDRPFADVTVITDGIVDQLKRMKTLKVLDLENTKISEKGLEQLRKELPKTTIFPGRSKPEHM
jgi:hypothetical protein